MLMLLQYFFTSTCFYLHSFSFIVSNLQIHLLLILVRTFKLSTLFCNIKESLSQWWWERGSLIFLSFTIFFSFSIQDIYRLISVFWPKEVTFGFGLGLCSCVLFWFGFGLWWACDIEGDGDERKRELMRFFGGGRRRSVREFFFLTIGV